MITQTTPAGINVGPISGPRTQTNIRINPVSVQPIFTGQNQALNRIRIEETIFQQQEENRLAFLQNAQNQFKAELSSGGNAELITGSGLGVDSSTQLGREALSRYNEYTTNFQKEMADAVSQATSGSSRLDGVAAQREIALKYSAYQEKVLNDPAIIKATKGKLELDAFDKALEDRAKNKDNKIDYSAALQARRDFIASQDDLSGETTFDRKRFDPTNYVFDKKSLNERLDEILTLAVNESEITELVSAAELGQGFTEEDGSVLRTQAIQNEREKAERIANEMLGKDERLKQFLRSEGIEPISYMKNKLDTLLREDEKRIMISKLEGFSGVQTAQRQRQKLAAEQKRKETVNMYGIEGDSAAEKNARDFLKTLETLGATILPGRNQTFQIMKAISDYNKDLEDGDLRLQPKHVQLDEDGNIIIRKPVEGGDELGEIIDEFGLPNGVDLSKVDPVSSSVNIEGTIINENLNPGFNNEVLPAFSDRPTGRKNGSWYTNNPLNYKTGDTEAFTVHETFDYAGDGNYHIVFGTMQEGFDHAVDDIRKKLTGRSRVVGPESTLTELYGKFSTSSTPDKVKRIADAIGVSPDITMKELSEQKTPEEVVMGLMRQEAPEIYNYMKAGGRETTPQPSKEAAVITDPDTPTPPLNSTSETTSENTQPNFRQTKKEIHEGVAKILNPQSQDMANLLSKEVITPELREEVLEYVRVSRELREGGSGKSLLERRKKQDKLLNSLMENPELRSIYLKNSVPSSLVTSSMAARVVGNVVGMSDGDEVEFTLPSGSSGLSDMDVSVVKLDDEYIIDVDVLGPNNKQYIGGDVEALINNMITELSPTPSPEDYDKAAQVYIDQQSDVEVVAPETLSITERIRQNLTKATSSPTTPAPSVTDNFEESFEEVVPPTSGSPTSITTNRGEAIMTLEGDGSYKAIIRDETGGVIAVEQSEEFDTLINNLDNLKQIQPNVADRVVYNPEITPERKKYLTGRAPNIGDSYSKEMVTLDGKPTTLTITNQGDGQFSGSFETQGETVVVGGTSFDDLLLNLSKEPRLFFDDSTP